MVDYVYEGGVRYPLLCLLFWRIEGGKSLRLVTLLSNGLIVCHSFHISWFWQNTVLSYCFGSMSTKAHMAYVTPVMRATC